MRIRKEDKIILDGEEMIKELNRIYLKGICIDQYSKLLEEYKKLYKRYEKTIKVSDNIENSIMHEKESLNDNLDYTIKMARSKLFENINEHKKTKNTLLNYKEKTDQYKNVFEELISEKISIQKRLDIYIKSYGEINHEFSDRFENSERLNKDIRNTRNKSFQNISLERVLSLAFVDKEKDFILIKLEMNDFMEISKAIKSNISIKSFIEKIQMFIENNLSKDSVVYYDENGVFYVALIDKKIEDAKLLENKLNKKRNIYNFELSFNIVISEFEKDKDSIPKLINKCDIEFQK